MLHLAREARVQLAAHEIDTNFQNASRKLGYNRLQYACANSSVHHLEAQLALRDDFKVKTIKGENLMHLAVCSRFDTEEKLELLMKFCGYQIDEGDANGYTPLHHAICWGRHSTLGYLLLCGADVNLTTSKLETPMHLLSKWAFHSGDEPGSIFQKCDNQVNLHDAFGFTPFHYAVLKRSANFVETLLNYGADVNVKTNCKKTILHLLPKATCDSEVKLLRLVQKCHNQINLHDSKHLTPIQYAVKFGSASCVDVLIKHGADFTVTDHRGFTLLHLASESQTEVESKLQIIIRASGDMISRVCNDGYNILQNATLFCKADFLKLLLQHGVNFDVLSEKEETILHLAAKTEEDGEEKASMLIDDCSGQENKYDSDGYTPLHYAIVNQNADFVGILLAHGADVKQRAPDNCTLMHLLVQSNIDLERKYQLIVDPCRDQLSERNAKENTPIQEALSNGNATCIDVFVDGFHQSFRSAIGKVLVQRTMDNDFESAVDSQSDVIGSTNQNFNQLTQLLVLNKDVINRKNREGHTSLHIACSEANAGVVQCMLELGADPFVIDSKKQTSIHKAVLSTYDVYPKLLKLQQATQTRSVPPEVRETKSVISDMFDMEVDGTSKTLKRFETASFECPKEIQKIIEIVCIDGVDLNTPPHTFLLAIRHLSFSVCKRLFQKGASVDSAHKDRESALHAAVAIGSVEKCKFLVENGADKGVVNENGLDPIDCAILYSGTSLRNQLIGVMCRSNDRKRLDVDEVLKHFRKCRFYGESKLNFAVRMENLELVKACYSKDKILDPDNTGVSPFELAHKHRDIQKFMEKDVSWIDRLQHSKTKKMMTKWYSKMDLDDEKLSPDTSPNVHPREIDEILEQSAVFLNPKMEPYAKSLIAELIKMLRCFSEIIRKNPKYAHFAFEPTLAGSMGEKTKTFVPNEADVVCKIKDVRFFEIENKTESESRILVAKTNEENPWLPLCSESGYLIPMKFSVEFYNAIHYAIGCQWKTVIDCFHLSQYSLQRNDKISCMHILYRGIKLKDMVVNVDLVPAISHPTYKMERGFPYKNKMTQPSFFLIPKVSKREEVESPRSVFLVSYSDIESNFLRALPENIRKGFIYAKAARSSSICQPADAKRLGLETEVSIGDYITTYMLKTCLMFMVMDRTKRVSLENQSSKQVALAIYNQLGKYLGEGGGIPFFFDEKRKLFKCDHSLRNPYDSKEGCCLKRDVMRSIIKDIRQKLKYC